MNHLTQVFKNELFRVEVKRVEEDVLFNAEDVALNLGILDTKNGVQYVRWNRVNSYLPKSSPQVAKGDFIPEALVYKLAFKAQNEVAEQFQDWLAIEVIPSIRKTGGYQVQKPSNGLELALHAALEHEREIKEIKSDVGYLMDNMRINGPQEQRINKNARGKIVECLGGKDSAAYKSMSKKVFSLFWNEFKSHFQIPRYGELPKVRFDEALDFIREWAPSTSLRFEIKAINNQQHLKLVD